MINSKLPFKAENLFTYVENMVSELQTKGLLTQVVIPKGLLDFGTHSPIIEISDTVCMIDYIYTKDTDDTHWQVVFEFGTFTSSNQLHIKVNSDDYILEIEDNYLEQLKLAIKKAVKSDWKEIIWLMDKDSEILSIALYPSIYQVENLARQLINEIMTKEYGIGWWDAYVPLSIQNKHRTRIRGYKSAVPSFTDVDERLMSIDIGDLITIFTLKEQKWVPLFDTKINSFLNRNSEMKIDRIKDILSAQMVVTKDLWVEQFSKYLSNDFVSNFKKFELNRNHVVHNKLIDRVAYGIIFESIQVVEKELKNSLQNVYNNVISVEQHELLEENRAIEEQELEASLLEIMESETGVRIRSFDEIIDLFDDELYEFHSEFQSYMRFRNDIEIGDYQNILSTNSSGTLFEITYKISGETSTINYSLDSINDSQGDESTVEVSIEINSEHYSKLVRYINGEVIFNSHQGNYMPETQDAFYTTDLENLMDDLVEFLDKHFENVREKVDSDIFSIVKDGGNNPVAEGVYCYGCGEEYVCVDDTYGEYGQCLSCGEKNDIIVCDRCGCYFENELSDSVPKFCENCIDYIEKQ